MIDFTDYPKRSPKVDEVLNLLKKTAKPHKQEKPVQVSYKSIEELKEAQRKVIKKKLEEDSWPQL